MVGDKGLEHLKRGLVAAGAEVRVAEAIGQVRGEGRLRVVLDHLLQACQRLRRTVLLKAGPGEGGQSLLLVLGILGSSRGRLIGGDRSLVVAECALKLADVEMSVA